MKVIEARGEATGEREGEWNPMASDVYIQGRPQEGEWVLFSMQ